MSLDTTAPGPPDDRFAELLRRLARAPEVPVEGAELLHYRIVGQLGRGGMGAVFAAEDKKLGRSIAIKRITGSAMGDATARLRLQKEARAAAALNHPNIVTVHAVEEVDGIDFIVMELVEGEPLSALVARGPLPLAEVLAIGAQIADALGCAHDGGLVHRDVKPQNVMVGRRGHVKVLDFGVAKRLTGDDLNLTEAGALVGTLPYMSPEQLRGEPINAGSDVFSLGCVLYEMATGQRAFPADDVATCVRQITSVSPPAPSTRQRGLPAAFDALVARAMNRDRGRRFASGAEVAAALRALDATRTAGAPGSTAASRPSWLRTVPLAALALAGAVALSLRWMPTSRAPARVVATRLTQITSAPGVEEGATFAPDGAALVYARLVGKVRHLFRRALSDGREEALTTGDFDEIQPTFAPDGRSLLFVRAARPAVQLRPSDLFGIFDAPSTLVRLDLAGHSEAVLAHDVYGPSVSPDGRRIAVAAHLAGPNRIWLLDENGANPQQVSGGSSEAVFHSAPRFSPDGRLLAYQTQERTRFDVRLATLSTRVEHALTDDNATDVQPAFSPSGRYVYWSSDRGGGLNVWRAPIDADGAPAGPFEQVTTGAGKDVEPALSPDGKRLAFTTLRLNADLWRLPVSPSTGLPTGAPEAVSPSSRDQSRGAYSPDGARLAFNSDRGGDMNLWVMSLADLAARPVTQGPGGDYQPQWSPDGKRLAFFSSRDGRPHLFEVDVDSGRLTQLTAGAQLDINPFYSPDGRSLAFHSDRSGRLELWVARSDGSEPRQLTRSGSSGHFLRWSKAGDAVLCRGVRDGSPVVLRVPLDGSAEVPLPEVKGGSHLSLSPDGQRVMDVVGHQVLWVSPFGGTATKVFEFPDASVRIDYPVWSPDGRFVLFDRFAPEGGDVWTLQGLVE